MKRVLFITLATAIMCSGCSISLQNAMLSHNYSKENIDSRLEKEDYRVVRNVSAKASATYILGIGGLSPAAQKIFASSYDKMVQQANLKPNQAIINVISEKRVNAYFYPFFARQVVHTTGTIIEFTGNKYVSTNSNSNSIAITQNKETITRQAKTTINISPNDKLKLYGSYKDSNGNLCIVINLSEDGKHGKAIMTHYPRSYKNATAKCEELGKGWRIPTKAELMSIFKNREKIDAAIQAADNNAEGTYQSDYWYSDAPQSTIHAKNLKTKTRSSAHLAELITILDF